MNYPRLLVERARRIEALGPAPAWWRFIAWHRWLREHRCIMSVSMFTERCREHYPPNLVDGIAQKEGLLWSKILKS